MGIPDTAMFGAGCFWGVEAAFRKVRGVLSTEVGYEAGGNEKSPVRGCVYRADGTCGSGTAPGRSRCGDIQGVLATFWSIHDPTQKDRQGPDIGTNYRSVIFYQDTEQQRIANLSKEELDRLPV